MSDIETLKTSDEILNELFHSLNLPVSPSAEKCATQISATVKFSSDKDQAPKKLLNKKRKDSNNSESDHAHSPKGRKKSSGSNSKGDKRRSSRSRSHSRSSSRSRSRSKSKSYHSKSSRSRGSSKRTGSRYSSRDRSRSNSKSKNRRSRSPSNSRYRRSRSRRAYRSRSHSSSRYRYSRSNSRSRYRRSWSRSRSKSRDRRYGRTSHSRNKKSYHDFKRDSKYKRNRSSDSSDDDYYYRKKKSKNRSYSKSPPRKKTRSPSLNKKAKDPLDLWKQTKLAKLKMNSNKSEKDLKLNANDIKSEESSLIEASLSEDSSMLIGKKNVDLNREVNTNITTELHDTTSVDNINSHPKEPAAQEERPPDVKFVPLPIIELGDSISNTLLKTDDPQTESKNCAQTEAKPDEAPIDGVKEQEKPKGIIIKSLKDSQVFQQAVEEAKKKPKDEPQDISLASRNDKEAKALEEGEVVSGNESRCNEKNKSKGKSHSKSKDRYSSKERDHRSKNSSRSSRHRRSWSRSSDRHRSRSRSSDRKSHQRDRKKSYRSQSKDPSRHAKSPDCVDSLRDKATRKRLLEIARKNAVYLMKNNCLPPSIERESLKATGKSVEELTNFCKQLVTKGDYSDAELSDPSLSEEEVGEEALFSGGRHPFAIKDSKPILMNIRNAPMLPTKTNAERLADHSKLREQFPVSSGSQHRTKESEWVPVEKEEKEKEEPESVFEQPKAQLDISQVVSTRVNAMRRLQDNPDDADAMIALSNAQMDMENWVLSKQVPGQFTGTTGARVLSQEELASGYQAWARKEKLAQTAYEAEHQEVHLTRGSGRIYALEWHFFLKCLCVFLGALMGCNPLGVNAI